MMIDPTTILAFSMHKYKGVYALLLGSGISRSSGIPTGWEIVLDLTRQLARAQGQNIETDPAAWYREAFGSEPDYSDLLDVLAKSPAERNQLLRPYFEPQGEEERRSGIKLPTPAHKAIARLVAGGHIRVIITTNFDRLLEQALESEGIIPSVIATADAVDGTLPVNYNPCTIIKVHGDYRDTRIKNTSAELSGYDARIDKLLDRVFDEYGLIVCGWSAQWDEALRNAIMRSPNHRFTTFWVTRSTPKEQAQEVIAQRRAEVISAADADTFFQVLEEQVASLDSFERPHPLSARVMAETVKRHIEDNQTIRLRDVVMQIIDALQSSLTQERFPLRSMLSGQAIQERLGQYESLSEVALAGIIVGSYWSSWSNNNLWAESIERVYPTTPRNGDTTWLNLSRYSALLMFYGAGISALAGKRYEILADLLLRPISNEYDERETLVSLLFTSNVLGQDAGRLLPEMNGEKRRTPTSDHLFTVLQKPIEELLYKQGHYEYLFDQFEYLLAAVNVDLDLVTGKRAWGQPGCYAWRRSFPDTILPELEVEIDHNDSPGPLLLAGLFGGSLDRYRTAKKNLFDLIQSLGWGW